MSGVTGTAARGNVGTQSGATGRRPAQVPVEMNLQTALKQARQLFIEGRLDDSAKLAVAILTKRPGNPMAVQIMAAVAEKKGKPERAIDILRSSLTGRKTDAMAQLNLCRLYKTRGQVAEAIASGESALAHGDRKSVV